MDENSVQVALLIVGLLTFFLAVAGWVYQLGFGNARIIRNEKDIEKLEVEINKHKDSNQAREDRIVDKISKETGKLFEKIDSLPCNQTGWTPCGVVPVQSIKTGGKNNVKSG